MFLSPNPVPWPTLAKPTHLKLATMPWQNDIGVALPVNYGFSRLHIHHSVHKRVNTGNLSVLL